MSEMQGGSAPAGALPFIYGHVDPSLFPAEQLAAAAQEALIEHSQAALNYGPELGCAPLRAYLREKLARDEGLALEPAELMLTAGASAGLDTAVRLFARPGDTVLVEAPSYHEALAIIRDYPVKLAAVPLDGNGLRVDLLAERLEALVRAGERPALLYTIPTFQNPSGVTLSTERRLALLDLACQVGFLVVADDVYRDLYFETPPPPSLYALDDGGGRVLLLGSFAKILAPGLRLGWALGCGELIGRLARAGLTQSGGGANPTMAQTTAIFCQRGWLEPHIQRLRDAYRARRDVLLTALGEQMPAGVEWTRPGGGFFVWLTLPAPLTSRVVLAQAEKQNVTFLAGDLFYAEGSQAGERHLRLPFSFVPRPELVSGVERLAGVVRQLLATAGE